MSAATHYHVAALVVLLAVPTAAWRVSPPLTASSDSLETPLVVDSAAAAVQLASLENASLGLDDFINASLEEDLARCVITASNGRQLTLGKTLGEGAEGTVYKARDQSGKYAAVKLLKPGRELDMQEVRNLQALSKVRSNHINNLEEGFENVQACCGRPCLVTEIIHGKDAAKIMWDNGIRTLRDVRAGKARKGALSYKLLRSILLQSLAAFRDTEKAGLCNYDQHLRNIMYEEETERIVFIDFGHASSRTPCAPTGPFQDEYSDQGSLQSFRSLRYLLEDAADAEAYLQLCDRIAQSRYTSAEDTLLQEAFASSPPSAQAPGAFFALHGLDSIITQQLEALLANGSPHVGRVSGKGPWEGAHATLPGQPSGGPATRPGSQWPGSGGEPAGKPVSDPGGSSCGQCSRGAACVVGGTCLHVADGYVVDESSCAARYSGVWCAARQTSRPVNSGSHGPHQPQPHTQPPGNGAHQECCRAGGCVLGSQCFGRSQGYAIDRDWCSKQRGQWCR